MKRLIEALVKYLESATARNREEVDLLHSQIVLNTDYHLQNVHVRETWKE